MRFTIITFGCQMNVLDSDWLSRSLVSRGWTRTEEDGAEVFIINTCSVRAKPEQKVHSVLGRLTRMLKADARPGAFAAVAGCVAQQCGREFLSRYPLVRLVFGPDGLAAAPDALVRLASEPDRRMALLDTSDVYVEREPALLPGDHGLDGSAGPRSAFVNIMQGCDNFCTYCIVPYVRGPQRSRSAEAVLDECGSLTARGVREITLLGQNVNSYGQDGGSGGPDFAELLRRVGALAGLDRLRFTTSHPKDIADEVVAAFGELDNLCPHLHLPLQAGSDRILRRMGRKYDSRRYLGIVDRLRAARPDITLTTDLIVAFPGETGEDFQATLDLVERVGFDSSFSFVYSDRPGVAAERMTPKVDPEEASARLTRLQNLQNAITRSKLERCVGNASVILCDGQSRMQGETGRSWRGRDPGGRIVNVTESDAADLAGSMLPVRIIEAKNHSLLGERTGEPW